MKKILLPVVLAMLGTSMFTSCSNDESLAVDKVSNYKENFEKVFGQVSPGQNFNTQKTLSIESSVTDMQGNYTLRVYDGVPSRKGSSLLGKFENLSANGTSTVQVGVSKTTKHIYCIADNGEVRQSLSAQVASKARVTAKFDAADGAPTEAPAYSDDQLSTVTIAFEDLGSTDDFDFNDAVVKVEYATGTGVANVTLMAVGAVLPLKLYYVGGRQAEPLFDGQELHAAMGYDQDMMINTNRKAQGKNDGVDNVSFVTCEIDVPEDFTIGEDGAPFLLEVDGVQDQRQITASTEYGAIPQVLVTGKYYDEQTRTSYLWRWPKERVRLNLAFPTIAEWMADATNLAFLAAGVESNLYDGYDPTVVDEQPQQPTTETPEGLEAVDLGLPSGTKWANMNVGAESPEDYGGYYAWGETEEKDWYDWSTYIHCDGSAGTCHDLGDDIAGTEYDVAHVKWGGDWQMPTLDQLKELLDNTTSTWTTQNGVNGRLFTGTNGNSIFLPASGYRRDNYLGHWYNGYYWSSTRLPWYSDRAYELFFSSLYADWDDYGDRFYGQSVRPVHRK
ncbi:MAG: DUF4114 domain-containing protein [Bacteroidaceae bacterium]|nr:DUF4114 domain-containing protein [Bacteroidaceae bacterium]